MSNGETVIGNRQRELSLGRALHHLNRAEVQQAESVLSLVLATTPTDAEALQLLGVIRRMQGRDLEAEGFYRQSLAVNPLQANVHNNLGNLLKAQSRFDEAIEALREATRLKPNYAEAHLNLGLALSAQGNHFEAEKCCRAALRIQPNYVLAKQSLASELNELNRPKEAEKVLRSALHSETRNPGQIAALEHELGIALKLQGRHAEALALFDAARAKVPDMPILNYNRGNTLQSLGRLDEAVASYSRALRADPLNLAVHDNLNKLLYRIGDDKNFLKSYDDVAALYPEMGIFPMKKGNLLFLKGEFDAARASFEAAVRLLPNEAAPRLGLALVLARSNEFEAAIREHEIIAGMEPENAQTWRSFAETLLRAGDPERARETAEKAIVIQPQNQSALATWTVALRLLQDPREKWMNDYDRFVRVYELPPPQGYGDMESFNLHLNAYLDRLHSGTREFIDQTLRTGTQTLDDLFDAKHAPVELLRRRIDEAVTDYIGQMESDPNHPLLRHKSAEFKYAGSWSARLHDCGFHTNHVHPKGWISSAYYVALPDGLANTESDDGWIKFGEPNFDCGLVNPVERKFQPKVGTLILFPSYMWHGTVPFRSAKSRTSIAFDVAPPSA